MVDLFAGAGGLSLGLQRAGFTPVFACDADRYGCATYERNIGGHVLNRGIADVSADLVLRTTGLARGDVTLVSGGPPCQGFSVQRRGPADDSRNDLVLTFGRLAVAIDPKVILMENVPTILGRRGARYLDRLLRILSENEYDYDSGILNAVDYGVPQFRRRAFLLAWKRGIVDHLELPTALCSATSWKTVREAIGDLPEPPADGSEHPDFQNHKRVRVSKLNELRISHVPPGGGRVNIPPELQLPCHRNDNAWGPRRSFQDLVGSLNPQ